MSMNLEKERQSEQQIHHDEEEEEEDDDDDEVPEISVEDGLSEFTLLALQAHLQEKDQENEWVVGNRSEVYNMSQFWYDEETSHELVQEALAAPAASCDAKEEAKDSVVAVLSAPSLLTAIKDDSQALGRVSLLEYDDRFGIPYPDQFYKYDFREPEVVPHHLVGSCDVIFLDPPYLNMDTIREYFVSANILARHSLEAPTENNDLKKQQQPPQPVFTRVMVVTAAHLEEDLREEFGLRPTRLEIGHASKLGNPLKLYTNYRPIRSGPWEDDEERREVQDE